MCGRTALSLNPEQIRCACSYKPKGSDKFVKPDWINEYNVGKEYTPSYNIAPSDVTPVLLSRWSCKNPELTEKVLRPMVWGVIPNWWKGGDYKKHGLTTHNCRLESIKTSKLYGPLLKRGSRCVIVVEGFYEWDTKKGSKKPYFVYEKQNDNLKIENRSTWKESWSESEGWRGVRLMYIAGLCNGWMDIVTNTAIQSYAVITMESNHTLNWLHDRMPAILNSQQQIDAWLDVDNVSADMAVELLKPTTILDWHPVSTEVNNAKNKSAACVRRQAKSLTCKKLTAWFKPVEKRKTDEASSSKTKKLKIN